MVVSRDSLQAVQAGSLASMVRGQQQQQQQRLKAMRDMLCMHLA